MMMMNLPPSIKQGDVTTTSNVENKLATNPTSYEDTEKQLFANMYLSASHILKTGMQPSCSVQDGS